MQIYLVGGAVRDRLLGLPVRERDWVVVGATPADLEAQGYRRVGRSFPVYLHPTTHEEYALARTELKTGPGYHGFDVRSDPSVTLEEDLRRRDLTINAIAEDSSGALIDPAGGQAHLRERLLHHVSDAFREDPVRVLRVARFAARFHGLGFRVAEATRQLMREMVEAGEVAALVPERVWQETESALGESRPDIYFEVLHDCGAQLRCSRKSRRCFLAPPPPRVPRRAGTRLGQPEHVRSSGPTPTGMKNAVWCSYSNCATVLPSPTVSATSPWPLSAEVERLFARAAVRAPHRGRCVWALAFASPLQSCTSG